jgi:hypothetical protein
MAALLHTARPCSPTACVETLRVVMQMAPGVVTPDREASGLAVSTARLPCMYSLPGVRSAFTVMERLGARTQLAHMRLSERW